MPWFRVAKQSIGQSEMEMDSSGSGVSKLLHWVMATLVRLDDQVKM